VLDNIKLKWLPAGAREVSPLVVMLFGISIPVALIAVAASGGSTAVLVLAILAMFVVGGLTMGFMALLTDDGHDQHDSSDDRDE
jgi:hypothetical protein